MKRFKSVPKKQKLNGIQNKHFIVVIIFLTNLLISLIVPVCTMAGFLTLPTKENFPISCGFGCYTGHSGVDYSTGSVGKDVVAAHDGEIIDASDVDAPNDSSITLPNSFGNYIKIDHGLIDGKRIITTYAHLLHGSFKVEKNDRVYRGELIAKSGNSGTSTAPHLHFQVNVNGIAKNPYDSSNYLWTENPPVHQQFDPIKQITDCIGNICWSPRSVSCENAQSWYRLKDPPYAEVTDSSSCNQISQEIAIIAQSESPNEEIQEEHWWQSWWRSLLNMFGPTASADDIRQYIVTRTVVVYNNGEVAVTSGNGTSINDATGQGYESPAIETPIPLLPDFTEYQLKLLDTDGMERYTYYLYDDKMEMHYWSTNIGEADWAGDAEAINVRFYLSKGYKARNSEDDWVRVGTEQIKKGNLNVGAIKHEWHTLDLTQYFSNGYIQPDHAYNIVVCVDREYDTDNGDGEVPEMHESNNCTSEAVFYVKESSIPTAEREALVALYDNANGAGWKNSTGWKTNSEPCKWYGVYCSGGHVTWLSLSNNQLSGPISPEIGKLTQLEQLDLSMNQLSGSIPAEIGNLTNLTMLMLGDTQLNGSIPAEIGNLSNLKYLYLVGNQLSGSIPAEIGNITNLTGLNLGGNQLSGSIPAEIGNITNLTELALQNNQLSGPIQDIIGNLAYLTYLSLGGNRFEGNIPIIIGTLTNLVHLDLGYNQFSGPIPIEIGKLTELRILMLPHNQLSGSIPSQIGNLTNLTYLILLNNQLSGSIPSEIGNLTNLTWLSLYSNQLSGTIPLPVAKIGAGVGDMCNFTFNTSSLCIPDTTEYQALGKDPICGLPLSSSCITGIPQIQIIPSPLNFGYVPPGSYKDLTLTVKNIGTGILTGTVSASPPFNIVSGGSYSLGANQSQSVVVRYTAPLQEGSLTGSVTFTGGGGSTVQVKGTNMKPRGLPWLQLLLGD